MFLSSVTLQVLNLICGCQEHKAIKDSRVRTKGKRACRWVSGGERLRLSRESDSESSGEGFVAPSTQTQNFKPGRGCRVIPPSAFQPVRTASTSDGGERKESHSAPDSTSVAQRSFGKPLFPVLGLFLRWVLLCLS